MNILVTGGGGYIGSFMVKALCDRGDSVSVVDNFKRGYRDAVDSRAQIFEGDLLDKDFVKKTFSEIKIDAVIHFAGLISVAESVERPGMYFESNILGTLNILEEIKEKNIEFIFSSTAAVYGDPETVPIPEGHRKSPTSPYGMSKLMVEDILSWYNQIFGMPFTALRYFNASGASLDGSLGERHNPETHIIPNAILSLINKKPLHLFGQDYSTPDGTCIRDYIHVLDLVEAHVLALDRMDKESKAFYNVGTGKGFSNKEIIDTVEKVAGEKLDLIKDKRRSGDPDELVADVALIKKELGFEPNNSDIETVVKSAYQWHLKQMRL